MTECFLRRGDINMAKKRRTLKDVKAERAEKKRKSRRRKRVFVFFAELFILLTLLFIGYVLQKYGKISSDIFNGEQVHKNEGVEQEGYTTIALFGGDSREGELGAGTHSDTIMIASINNQTKEVKIVSVYRDTTMRQKDGEILKANSAYFLGGPQEAVNMLNRNLDLDIEDYVTVDFKVLAEVIDLLGGIEVEVSAAEADEMNNYIHETAMVAGKEVNLVKEGFQNLDGVQAVTYARIRKNVGGDYARTERQRLVITKIVEKVKKTSLVKLNEIIDSAFEHVSTSFELGEVIRLAAGVMKYEIDETSGFPFEKTDGTIEGVGSVVVPLGMTENVEELHGFLYPNEEYQATDTIKEIAGAIENLTGYTRADYVNP